MAVGVAKKGAIEALVGGLVSVLLTRIVVNDMDHDYNCSLHRLARLYGNTVNAGIGGLHARAAAAPGSTDINAFLGMLQLTKPRTRPSIARRNAAVSVAPMPSYDR